MEIGGQWCFYEEEKNEQRAIGRGERERVAAIETEDLYASYEERAAAYEDRLSSTEPLTPAINQALLVEAKRLREDKLIINGVATQIKEWQKNNLSTETV